MPIVAYRTTKELPQRQKYHPYFQYLSKALTDLSHPWVCDRRDKQSLTCPDQPLGHPSLGLDFSGDISGDNTLENKFQY